jgi:hypothetical protein
MNVTESFVNYLVTSGIGTFGTDIFIGSVPINAPNACYWVKGGGGNPTQKNETGEMIKDYFLDVYYRDTAQNVYDNLQILEELLNSGVCNPLADYDALEISTTSFPIDEDLDSEDRSVGMLRVAIKIYSS